MINNFTKTLKINNKNFDEIKGQRFYYSSWTTWITAIIFFSILVLFIYSLFTSLTLGILWILGILVSLYYFLQVLYKVIYKNPIFIINGNQLFYTKTEKWYDLTQCDVSVSYIGQFNFTGTLIVKSGNGKTFFDDDYWSFDENYWLIEFDDDLKKIMERYYKNEY